MTPSQKQKAIEQVLTDARKALVQWENICAEFLPGHCKLRPEFSECEVASHQAQVSIRQLIGSLDTLIEETREIPAKVKNPPFGPCYTSKRFRQAS